MAINRQSGSAGPFADRYKFDFKSCSYANGWAQIDTTQDASYYGTWTSPERRQIFNYCEGDTYLTTADTDAEYVEAVRETAAWNKERGYWLGIDAGFDDRPLYARFVELGLADLLH